MRSENEFGTPAEVESWLKKVSRAEGAYADYHRLVGDIRKYYRNDTHKDKQNIFWSSIETLKPFLYFKQPKPYVERKEKTSDKVQNLACRMLEKALLWNMEQFDFDSVVKYARNDFLLSGSGMLIERYRPEFGVISGADGAPMEIKTKEKVVTEYVNPADFIADSEKVGIWEECNWFAIRQYMSVGQVLREFGEDIGKSLTAELSDKEKTLEVYEIWDKESGRVLYLSKSCPSRFLKMIGDMWNVTGFFPMPKPLLSATTNDTLIPVPDYVEIKGLLDELDGVTARMEKTMKALKVSGCYDNAFPELASILNKEVTLVALSDFDRLKAAGGIKNIVDFMPVEQYVTALQTLAARRQDIVSALYELTGVSNIMRGSSAAGETATAVVKKTNFGTLRNQDRQNDMQKFISELFRIKAEMICGQFDSETLLSFLPESEQMQPEAFAAVKLLKTSKLRGMVLGIESDVTYAESDKAQKNIETVTAIHKMISEAFDIVSKQPALLELYRQMIGGMAASLSNARPYESVLESCFSKIAAEFDTPDAPVAQPDIQTRLLAETHAKNQQDYEIKKEQNNIKKAELLLKEECERAKTAAELMRSQG